MTFETIIAIIWVVFWVYWIGSAFGAKRNINSGLGGRGAIARLAAFVLFVVLFRTGLGGDKLVITSDVLRAVGLILFLAGLAVCVWARRHLGVNWGMPMTEKQHPELVTSGPYHLIRHPIYSGLILALIGTVLATSLQALIVLAVLGAYFVYSAFVEEHNLARTFPEDYPRYRAHSKMLIPYVF